MPPARNGPHFTPRPILNCYWIVPGILLAGEYPRDIAEEFSRTKLGQITGAGISAFVDLTQEGEFLHNAHWLAKGTPQRLPIVDSSVPDFPELTTAILDSIDGHIEQGRRCYLPCRWGIGRSRRPGPAG